VQGFTAGLYFFELRVGGGVVGGASTSLSRTGKFVVE